MTEESPQERKDPEFPIETGEFICPFCGRQYPMLDALHTHIRRTHRRPPVIR